MRIHLDGDAPSIEGVLQGRWGGHYVVLASSVIEEVGGSVPTGHVEVPAERVLFVQVLGS